MAEMNIYEGALDKGLEGVVACTTAVSFIVGNTLNYRGYTIEDLSENSTFEEVIFLLWNNRLPKKSELEALKKTAEKLVNPIDSQRKNEGDIFKFNVNSSLTDCTREQFS